ncbi:C-C motif chemokine 19-like [Trichomycterus rosablanca]|uniref:C-C motif chemokine 19-like n=1 Tax=Trichomycterus rosablanca TaxID=2290929 RepID=UPI002F3506B5
MQTNAVVRSLAVVAVIAFTIWTVTDAEKVNTCCTKVSRSMKNETITNYRFQKKDPPCVRAVIFYTERGQLCIDPSQPWVQKKIISFKNSQKNKTSSTSASPRVTASVSMNSTASS